MTYSSIIGFGHRYAAVWASYALYLELSKWDRFLGGFWDILEILDFRGDFFSFCGRFSEKWGTWPKMAAADSRLKFFDSRVIFSDSR